MTAKLKIIFVFSNIFLKQKQKTLFFSYYVLSLIKTHNNILDDYFQSLTVNLYHNLQLVFSKKKLTHKINTSAKKLIELGGKLKKTLIEQE